MTTDETWSPACPICPGGGPFIAVDSHHDPIGGRDYTSYRCGACGLVFSHPFRHPGGDWYAKFCPQDSYVLGGWRFDWFLELGPGSGRSLLDIGCGTGNFLMKAREAGYRVSGVDSNPEAAAGAKERGLDVYCGSVAEYARQPRPASFDVVTMFDVIEHLDDPREMVVSARELLKAEGRLVITTPNGHRPVPFGRGEMDYPPHHLSRWTPEVLEAFLRREGFEVEYSCPDPLVTWEFSGHFIGRATKALLKLSKRILYGKAAAGATLTQLVRSDKSRGAVAGLITDKDRRVRLVDGFERTLGWVLAPFFLPMKWYYLARNPRSGSRIGFVARKTSINQANPSP